MTTMKQQAMKWFSKSKGRRPPRSRNLSDKVKAIARAHGTHVFNIGDPAVLLYEHKERVFKVLVRVAEADWTGPSDADGKPMGFAPEYIKYAVVSEHGGVMTVGAAALRPGNILDRISLALELDEVSEASE